MNPYTYTGTPWDWNMYNWNMSMYYAPPNPAMAAAYDMAYRDDYYRKYNSQFYLNSTMIDPQKQQQQPQQQQQQPQGQQSTQQTLTSQVPPPTPFYPMDPYSMAAAAAYMGYAMPPPPAMLQIQPPSTPYNMMPPPPTPGLLNTTQNTDLNTSLMDTNNRHLNEQQQQQRLMAQTPIQDAQFKQRNTSTSSFKHEVDIDMDNGSKIAQNEELIEPKKERLTPFLYPKPHIKAKFGLNTILKIKANDPCEGQPALVEIHNLYDLIEDYLNNDPNYRLLQEFPGPLIK